jgi:hypothetical protein
MNTFPQVCSYQPVVDDFALRLLHQGTESRCCPAPSRSINKVCFEVYWMSPTHDWKLNKFSCSRLMVCSDLALGFEDFQLAASFFLQHRGPCAGSLSEGTPLHALSWSLLPRPLLHATPHPTNLLLSYSHSPSRLLTPSRPLTFFSRLYCFETFSRCTRLWSIKTSTPLKAIVLTPTQWQLSPDLFTRLHTAVHLPGA